MKDKRNRHGAVGKSSSEQHFHTIKVMAADLRKFWSPTPSATGSYGRQAGWLSGWLSGRLAGRRNTGEFLNFQSWL